MNNYEKQQLAVKIAIAAFDKAGIETKLRQDGKVTQLLIHGRWYDIHGNFNGYWPLARTVRDKILVYQETPTNYRIFKISAEEMYKIAILSEADDIKDGHADIDKETGLLKTISSGGHTSLGFDRVVLDMKEPWLGKILANYELFNN
jgi:hypothetical protein